MLITNLGHTRTQLFASFLDLTDEQLNWKPGEDKWSIAQVIHHLYTTEKDTAKLILNAMQTNNQKVEERDLSFLSDRSKKRKAKKEPPTHFMTKEELVQLLEESRFKYLQDIFNETHERSLVEKSIDHPSFGLISLRNLVDFIWLHEESHTKQIDEIREKLNIN